MTPGPFLLRCIREKGTGQWAEDLEVKQTADSLPKWAWKERGREDDPGKLTCHEGRLWLASGCRQWGADSGVQQGTHWCEPP